VGQETAQQRQQTHQAQAYQAFSQAVSQAEASYRASQPDYDGAVDHMRQTRAADAQAFVEASGGVWDANTQAQVMQTITQEFAQLAATALQRGKSPAEVLYKLAQSRGYQPPSKSAETKLATIERGMAASKTVSNLSGSRANGQDNEQGVHWLTSIKRGAGYA
jgi:hypothetical protein